LWPVTMRGLTEAKVFMRHQGSFFFVINKEVNHEIP
jgi:hypothetical protein